MNMSIPYWRTSQFVANVLNTWFRTIISINLRLVYIIETRLRLLNYLVGIMLLIVVLVHDNPFSCGNPFNFLADWWSRSVCAILQMGLRVVSVERFSSARLVLACIERNALFGVASHDVRGSIISCTLLFNLNTFEHCALVKRSNAVLHLFISPARMLIALSSIHDQTTLALSHKMIERTLFHSWKINNSDIFASFSCVDWGIHTPHLMHPNFSFV